MGTGSVFSRVRHFLFLFFIFYFIFCSSSLNSRINYSLIKNDARWEVRVGGCLARGEWVRLHFKVAFKQGKNVKSFCLDEKKRNISAFFLFYAMMILPREEEECSVGEGGRVRSNKLMTQEFQPKLVFVWLCIGGRAFVSMRRKTKAGENYMIFYLFFISFRFYCCCCFCSFHAILKFVPI